MDNNAIEGYRLSPQQRELFFARGSATRVAQVALAIDGALDVERLVGAVRAVVARHEILRTRFQHVAGMGLALQVVADAPELELELDVDRAAVAAPPGDPGAALAGARRAPFDLARDAPLRCRLIAVGPERHWLIVTAPAVCLDARSLGNLAPAIAQAYAGGATGAGDDVIQYAQFCEWLNQLDEDDDADRGAAFWQQALAGAPSPLHLPLAEPPLAPAGEPRSIAVALAAGEARSRGDRWLAARGIAPDRYFLAAWLWLLARAAGQDEVQTELCCDGRTLAELDDALGVFTTGVPLRMTLDPAARAAGLVDAVAFQIGNMMALSHFCPRDPAARAELATGFEYVRAPLAGEAGGIRISVLERWWSHGDRIAIKLVVEQRAEAGAAGHALRLIYDPSRVAEPLAAAFAGALQHLCERLCEQPDAPVAELGLIGADAQRALVERSCRGAPADPSLLAGDDFATAFAAAAARWPGRLAYVYRDQATTYEALDRRANRIARALRARGVQPGTPVPLILDRGPHTLAGLVGILKAGAALLPLDLGQPARRLQAILADAAPIASVTRRELAARLPDGAGDAVLVDGDELDGYSADDPGVAIDPSMPAYVLYTSGSTGAPKGVVIRHGAVMNLARALQAEIYHRPAAPLRVSLNANLTFDSSVKQWTRLAFGDTLLGIPEDVRTAGDELRGYLEAHRCQVLDATPSQIRILLAAGLPAGLERALIGGEPVDAALWQDLVELGRGTGCQFFNVYGPTECTVNAAWTPIDERARNGAGRIAPVIGRPIPGCHVAIHDAHGHAVPAGFTGELWIGGAGVATGYFRDPARTGDRFVPDPYAAEPGARMYRSGDLARLRPDGAIELLGRIDHQIKLRGMRIELGEIEAALRRHAGVRDCAVMLREDRPGDARLVAYVVAEADGEAAEGYRLPNGMVVAHHNQNETAYLYHEIFEKQSYARYGIRLPANAVVFDVGANIGMYSLYALQRCEAPRIYAFEPLLPIAASLSDNLGRYGRGATVLRHGLGDQESRAEFTYYPRYTMMSGAAAYARPAEEVEVVRRYLEQTDGAEAQELLRHADELVAFRFEGERHACRLRRLSDVIREQGVEHIDVLKIDVQRAELDVLRGIDDEHWGRIDQIAMEVHEAAGGETAGRVAEIARLLERQGFAVAAEQDALLTGTDRHNLYASRLGLGAAEPGVWSARAAAEPLTAEGLQRHAAAWLPDHMIPQAVVMLDALPLSRHGKVDRAALPAIRSEHRARKAPQTPREQALAAIWSEVLGSPEIGVDDDFFRLGGHSLLATQLMARIRNTLAIEAPLRLIFEAPTIEKLARALDRHDARAAAAIAPVARDGRIPLSFAQQRLWFIDQLEPGTTAYHNAFAFRCRGALAADALDRALVAIATRHEVLRTRFVAADRDAGGESPVAYQVVDPPAERYLAIIDLSRLPAAEREAEARSARLAEARRPFDLARGPVFRAVLVQLAADDHLLLFTAHHIACDEWSLPIFARELGAAYDALCGGRAPELPALAVQYADVAAWQRDRLRGDELARQVAYWKRELAGMPQLLDLPLDRPRTTRRAYRGQHSPFALGPDASAALRALAQATSTTPFMLFLAGFAALLGRYAGQREVCIGTPVAGRSRIETEPLIGFFVNVLPIRIDLSGDPSFREVMARVRDTVLRALAHQELPFEKLVEELELPRDMSHSPLFQVSFHVRDAQAAGGDAELALAGSTVEAVDPGAEASIRYDLSLAIDNRGPVVRGALGYDASLFRPTTAAAIAGHLAELLTAIAADPDRPLAEIELATAGAAAPPVATAEVPATTLAALWRARVAAAPHAPAVCVGDRALDTAALDAIAGGIAHALRARGVGPDHRVAILADRSCELIAGILAVLLAGGAYVPLDPAYPTARLAWMIDDAAPTVVLAQAALADRLSASAGVLLLDGPNACHLGAPPDPVALTAAPDHLAYVLYTSGSTGVPKGVMVSHRNAVHLRGALRRFLYAGIADRPLRVTVNAPVVFDSSVKQLLTLFDGHCLYPVPEALRRDPERLVAWLGEQRIDVLDATPSFLQLLLDAGLLADPDRAPRHVLVGGEAIAPALWQTLSRAPRTAFHNVYGPTECTVNATAHTVLPDDALPVIGRALTGVAVYVLDDRLRPVPPGVTGELYIGGAGVSRGYRARASLTAERFLPDPFACAPGARMYRTGDLGRRSADGDLAFTGRADHQVKLRGHRIELGEIEATLLDHPGVRRCVAVVHPARGQQAEQLVAYVVLRPGHAPPPRVLRELAAARLPDYMVPAQVAVVDEIPLTHNKKVDLAALRAAAARRAPRDAGPAPAGDGLDGERHIEQVVAVVLSELLGRAEVGLDQDFFAELGGHSLLAIQFMSRLRRALGIALELRAVFDHPTPRRLARVIEQRLRRVHAADAPALEPVPRDRPLPLSFAQRRLWIVDRLDPGSPVYNNPKTVRIPGELDVAALSRAIDELVRRHEPLRTRFVAGSDGEPVQIIAPHAPVELAPIDLSQLAPADAEAEARRIAERAAMHRFDLTAGPLVRFQLIRLTARDHILIFLLHHIITDARSLDILWREAGALYEAFRAGRPSPLPELALQSADHAAWQHRWLAGDVLTGHLAYWRERLAGLDPIDLPCDHPRPPVETIAGRVHRFELDRETTAALARVAHAHDATVFMAVLAIYAGFLARLSRQDDIAIGTPSTGRSLRETEDMVGFFVNTLVVRCDASGAPSFAALLARVRETVLSAYAHQDIPFEKLVEELALRRDTSRGTLFQVALNYQERRSAADDSAPRFEFAPGVAKFDLTLGAGYRAGDGLALWLEYKTALFEPASIAHMARQLCMLAAAAVAAPDAPFASLPASDDDERAELAAWNATQVDLGADLCLHELIAAQAARTPDHIAVAFDDERVSYGELMARAHRLAHHLRSLGVGPEVPVAVLLERSVDLIVALVGVLAAGAAYVPLDPEHPPERLGFGVRDVGAPVLLTSRALADRPAPHGARVIRLDAGEVPATGPTSAPDTGATTDNLTYVIFTSGSTGVPKGCANHHRGVVNRLRWQQRQFPLRPGDKVLHKTPYTFDVSVYELYWPLMNGATLVLAQPGRHGDPQHLAQLIAEHGITYAHFVPSMLLAFLHSLDDFDGDRRWPSLRWVICSGEAMTPALVELFLARFGRAVELHNLYGPTECSVETTHWECHPDGAIVPIGRPIANTQVAIIDAALRPVPVGTPGELCIAGIPVGRGYFGRPALTAERFVPDPESRVPGGRMYRTGDLTRFRPASAGAIEFLGRIDFQVKLRGFRIELGEIESVLARHELVKQAVVVLRDEQLAAYVVGVAGAVPDAAALRDHLRKSLPDYMVPSSFTALERFPMTASGKVDRKALPAPAAPNRDEEHIYPRYELEWQVWTEMAEVLRLDAFGVTDNFFNLGGHSLAAVNLASRLAARCGRPVPLAAIFQHPTVEGLAGLLGRDPRASAAPASPLVELQRGAGKPPMFWVHPVGGAAFCYAALARALGPEQPVYAFQSPGIEPGATPIAEMDALVALYADLLQSRYPHGRIQLGGWSMGGIVAFELARQLAARGREVAPVVVVDAFVDPRPERETTTDGLIHTFLHHVGMSPADAGLAGDGGWDLAQMLDAVLARGKQNGMIPPTVGRDEVQRRFDVFCANVRALRGYRAGRYAGDVLLFHRADTAAHRIAAWREAIDGRLRAIAIDADHTLLMSPPHVHEIAARLVEPT